MSEFRKLLLWQRESRRHRNRRTAVPPVPPQQRFIFFNGAEDQDNKNGSGHHPAWQQGDALRLQVFQGGDAVDDNDSVRAVKDGVQVTHIHIVFKNPMIGVWRRHRTLGWQGSIKVYEVPLISREERILCWLRSIRAINLYHLKDVDLNTNLCRDSEVRSTSTHVTTLSEKYIRSPYFDQSNQHTFYDTNVAYLDFSKPNSEFLRLGFRAETDPDTWSEENNTKMTEYVFPHLRMPALQSVNVKEDESVEKAPEKILHAAPAPFVPPHLRIPEPKIGPKATEESLPSGSANLDAQLTPQRSVTTEAATASCSHKCKKQLDTSTSHHQHVSSAEARKTEKSEYAEQTVFKSPHSLRNSFGQDKVDKAAAPKAPGKRDHVRTDGCFDKTASTLKDSDKTGSSQTHYQSLPVSYSAIDRSDSRKSSSESPSTGLDTSIPTHPRTKQHPRGALYVPPHLRVPYVPPHRKLPFVPPHSRVSPPHVSTRLVTRSVDLQAAKDLSETEKHHSLRTGGETTKSREVPTRTNTTKPAALNTSSKESSFNKSISPLDTPSLECANSRIISSGSNNASGSLAAHEVGKAMAKTRANFKKTKWIPKTASNETSSCANAVPEVPEGTGNDTSVWNSGSRICNDEESKKHTSRALNSASLPFTPKKFTEPFHVQSLQKRMEEAKKLPTINEALDACLPEVLRNVPPIQFKGKKLREERALAEVRNSQSRLIKSPPTPLSSELVKSSPKPLSHGVKQKQSPSSLSKPGLRQKNVQKLPDNSMDPKLLRSTWSSVEGNRAAFKITGCVEEPLVQNDRFEPFAFDQMPKYNDAAIAYLSKESIGFEVDVNAYNDETHEGQPSQIDDANSFDAEDLSLGDDKRANEDPSQNEVFIWRWFTKALESLDTAHSSERSIKEVHTQVTKWDRNYETPNALTAASAEWNIGYQKVVDIENWLNGIIFTATKRPFSIDTKTDIFRSGKQMVTGMRRDYPHLPPWSMMPEIRPRFGPINWNKIQTLPPIDDFSNHPVRRQLTVEICCQVARKQQAQNIKQDKERDAAMLRQERESFHPPLKQKLDNNPWVPKANIIIRPARMEDMPQAVAIFNYYVEHSVQSTETTAKTLEFMEGIFRNVEEDRNVFLVAALKNKTKNLHNGRHGNGRRPKVGYFPDTIVGIAWVVDMGDKESSLRQMATIHMYVHCEYLRKGVGKNLFDRLMPCVDRTYQCHYGTDLEIEKHEWISHNAGGQRPKRKVLFDLYWETKDKDEFKWKKQWLERQGFHACSFFNNAAFKFKRPVNIVTMMRETETNGGNWSSHYMGERARYPDLIPGL